MKVVELLIICLLFNLLLKEVVLSLINGLSETTFGLEEEEEEEEEEEDKEEEKEKRERRRRREEEEKEDEEEANEIGNDDVVENDTGFLFDCLEKLGTLVQKSTFVYDLKNINPIPLLDSSAFNEYKNIIKRKNNN